MTDEERSPLERIEERLEQLEKKVDRSRAGGGGIGCLGFAMLVWVLLLLGEILERLPEG